jgi:tetratricopeptide (TPR) repeat protein/tRNA A-37 threonylcarbamoyl transferase component Bud32
LTSPDIGGRGGQEPGKVAHFEILGRLGAGGMGVVYRARDEVLDREVALKLIRREVAGEREVRQRFLREARLAAAINHGGVATLFEAGEAAIEESGETQLYLVSELVPGRSLEEILRDGPLDHGQVVELGVQLTESLQAAHELGIIHRDIKPSNVMVSADNRLKVLDFGIAKRVAWSESPGDDDQTLTYTARGSVVGTPAYMAPEQVAGGGVDARTDVHGVGCVLYRMLTGEPPYGTGSPSEVMRRVVITPPKPLRSLRAGVPAALAEVVEKALAKDPTDRYQTAEELRRGLLEASEATGFRRPFRAVRRSLPRWVMAVAAALLVAAVALVAVKVLNRPLPFDERDWLLVADVVNQTGDEGFDLALKSALETDLRQSRHVNVFDAGRLRNTLRMMRRADVREIDLETGLEVCRFAGIRALLVPQIDATGEVYILQASLVEPATGRIADHFRFTASGRDEVLLEAIDDLTRTVRRRLGESLKSIAETDPPLVQYTTSSWEAQRLVALGSRAWAGGHHEEAERCFLLALEEDPKFATARGSLGLLYIQFMNRADEGRALIQRAFGDADEVSRREYLTLRAIHRQFVEGNLEGALADYRLVSELYPDVVQPLNNAARILSALGRGEEAEKLYLRALEIDPDAAAPLWNLWTIYVQQTGRPAMGERVARDLVRIQPDSPWAYHSLAWALLAQRRFDEAEDLMRRVVEMDPNHRFARANLSHLLFRRGAFEEAERMYRRAWEISHPENSIETGLFDTLCLALALQRLGRWDEARVIVEDEIDVVRRLEAERPLESEELAYRAGLLATAGRAREAASVLTELAANQDLESGSLVAMARGYALVGEPDRAEQVLEEALEAGFNDPYYLLIDPTLAGLQDRPALEELAPAE